MSDHGRGNEATYGRSVFELIANALDVDGYARAAFSIGPNQVFKINDQGVWSKPVTSDGAPRWHPKSETRVHGGGNPYDEPLLPFPFTAKDLAAFMVDGYGKMFLRLEFGEWEDGPDVGADYPTLRLPPVAREAMDEAYAAYRVAEKGARHLLPNDVRELEFQVADAWAKLRSLEPRIEHVDENPDFAERTSHVDQLSHELENARAQDSDAKRKWRTAIVAQLLCKPEERGAAGSDAKVNWRRGLEALLPEIRRETGKDDVRTVIRELKKRGKPWGILGDGPNDKLSWKDDQGAVHLLTKKSVSNALSKAKGSKLRRSPPP